MDSHIKIYNILNYFRQNTSDLNNFTLHKENPLKKTHPPRIYLLTVMHVDRYVTFIWEDYFHYIAFSFLDM